MIRPTSVFSRCVAVFATFLMVNLAAMPFAFARSLDRSAPPVKPIEPPAPPQTRALTSKEMKTLKGKFVKNPYVAGANKWSISYKGVDLLTGNFSTSATDMTFEGGYGIPINVTRSYSSNSADEGPLGIGWNLSVDVRSTAGGILKSSSAPIRSVPVAFKERPSVQVDPGAVLSDGQHLQPPVAVLATDASGKEETEQRDVDGIISTPPWDKNTNNPFYEFITFNGSTYQILVHNESITPDGTTYVYDKQGTYQTFDQNGNAIGGGVMSDDGAGNPEPSNVLKITSVIDRQGNVTTYSYDANHTVQFAKTNGTTYEHPLTSIHMPNGHQIDFTWGNSSNAPANRVRTASDGCGRTVTYGYDELGNLASVTTPAGLTTSYGYGSTVPASDGNYTDQAAWVLTSITDPRGLTTTIGYTVENSTIAPYMVQLPAVRAYRVTAPNGVKTYYNNLNSFVPIDSYFYNRYDLNTCAYADIAYGETTPFQYGTSGQAAMSTNPPTYKVGMGGIGGVNYPEAAGASTWVKIYDSRTQDLVDEIHYSSPLNTPLDASRKLDSLSIPRSNAYQMVETTKSYNFMGDPLTESVTESSSSGRGGYTPSRSLTTDYAYWDESKYFQQRATRTQLGSTYRVTYTDYFDSSAPVGARGQTKAVYSPAFTTFNNVTASDWKYSIAPTDLSTAAAKFYDDQGNPAYDSQGRVTDVWKLQSTATNPWRYVQTHTTYGGDGAPHWGQAYQVFEDYGVGHINRMTTTNGYTSWGTANDVTDAAGHRFYTDYDADQKISSVTRIDVTPNVTLVSYTYGTSGMSKGQPTQVTDGLSNVVQTIAYDDGSACLGGKGQVSSVSETWGANYSYSTSYTYTSAGDRRTSTYATPNGTTKWGYFDYTPAGEPSSPSRIFQTLNKLDSNGNPTSEEMDYAYDGSGRLLEAAFGQTPQPGYDYTRPAASRALATYVYDSGGRLTDLNHVWQTNYSGSAYATVNPLIENQCAYEVGTGLNRGLKTASSFYVQGNFDHTEQYGYDPNLDYLTSASYNGGTTWTNWSYDAAGNRNDCTVVDNLNRATTIGGVSRTYDILGNTLTIGSSRNYAWDVLNRMISTDDGQNSAGYAYRADGMRVAKGFGFMDQQVDNNVVSTNGDPVVVQPTRLPGSYYYYDGQMPIEEDRWTSGQTVIRNGLGARGIDRIETVANGTTSVTYPIYDAHGNMIATLAASGSNYNISNLRCYDAWGAVSVGSTTGDPTGRYCANLGHVQDDESSLVYMRARYYEPTAGRFLSEDPGMQGINWMIYSGNNPVDQVDASGRSVRAAVMAMITAMLGGLSAECFVFACFTENPVQKKFFEWMSAAFAFMAAAMGIATAADAASDLAPGPAKLVCGVIAICSCAGALAAALGFYLAFRDWLALLDEEGALPDWLSAANNKLNYGTDGN